MLFDALFWHFPTPPLSHDCILWDAVQHLQMWPPAFGTPRNCLQSASGTASWTPPAIKTKRPPATTIRQQPHVTLWRRINDSLCLSTSFYRQGNPSNPGPPTLLLSPWLLHQSNFQAWDAAAQSSGIVTALSLSGTLQFTVTVHLGESN